MGDIRFVRIRGRIVPIRRKTVEDVDRKVRAGIEATGAGAATAGGVYGTLRKFHSNLTSKYSRVRGIAVNYAKRANALLPNYPTAPVAKKKVVDMFAMAKFRSEVARYHVKAGMALGQGAKAAKWGAKAGTISRAASVLRRVSLPAAIVAGVAVAASTYILRSRK